MTFENMIGHDRDIFLTNLRVSQKRELVNQVLQLCEESYSTLKQLSEDFPGSNFNNLYELYKDKIETLRGTLKEDNTLTKEIDKTLQEVLINVKNQTFDKYNPAKQKLKSLIDRTWN